MQRKSLTRRVIAALLVAEVLVTAGCGHGDNPLPADAKGSLAPTVPAMTPGTPAVGSVPAAEGSPSAKPGPSSVTTQPSMQAKSSISPIACKKSFVRMVDGVKHADFPADQAPGFTDDMAGKSAVRKTLAEFSRLLAGGSDFPGAFVGAARVSDVFCEQHPEVILKVPAPSPSDFASRAPDATEEAPYGEPRDAPLGMDPATTSACGQVDRLTVHVGTDTSCLFGKAIARAVLIDGMSGATLSVRSPVTKKTYDVICMQEPGVILCGATGTHAIAWLS